jgi:hypothetical protein
MVICLGGLISVKAFTIAAAGAIMLLLAAARPAQAFRLYTDRASWEAAVGQFTTEIFNTPIANSSVITFSNGVNSTGINGSISNQVQAGTYWGRVDTSNSFDSPDGFQEIRWTFTAPIAAFAANWIGTATASGLTVSGNFDGLGTQTISLRNHLGTPGTGFLGIVGTANFSELVFQEEFPEFNGFGDEFFQIDDFSIASTAAVPEPTTIAGFVLAGAGMVAMRRRQSR